MPVDTSDWEPVAAPAAAPPAPAASDWEPVAAQSDWEPVSNVPDFSKLNLSKIAQENAAGHAYDESMKSSDFLRAVTAPGTGVAAKAGQGLDMAGKVLAAAVAGAVKNPGQTLREEVPGEDSDIAQVLRGETPDYELERGLLPKPLQAAESGAYGLVKTVPQLAGVAGAQAAGVPAPLAAGALFGLTPEGFDPKQAAIGAALPFVGKYGGAITEAVAKKMGVSSKVAAAAVNKIGAASASAGVIGLDQVHSIMQLPPEQREKAWVDAFGNVAGMAGLGLMGGHEASPEAAEPPVAAPPAPVGASLPAGGDKVAPPTPQAAKTPNSGVETTPQGITERAAANPFAPITLADLAALKDELTKGQIVKPSSWWSD